MLISLCFDIALVVFFLCHIYYGIKKGFISSLLGFCGTLLSLIVSNLLSMFLANYVYDNFIYQTVVNSVTTELKSGSNGIVSSIQETLSSLPVFIRDYLNNININSNNINNILQMDIDSAAKSISLLIRPAVVAINQAIAFIILFFIVKIVLTYLLKILRKTNKLPIFGRLNKLLGAILGFTQALLLAYVICMIIRLCTSIDVPFFVKYFSEVNISASFLFKHLYNFNPLQIL